MPYIEAAKLGIKLALILLVICALEYDGYRRADNKWTIKTQDAEIRQREALRKANEQASQETQKSMELAQEFGVAKSEAEDRIQSLSDDLRKLSNDKRVRVKTVCNRAELPTNDNSGVPSDSASGYQLTREMEEFLLSSFRRGDEAGNYAKIAYEWARELCKQPNVVCTDNTAN